MGVATRAMHVLWRVAAALRTVYDEARGAEARRAYVRDIVHADVPAVLSWMRSAAESAGVVQQAVVEGEAPVPAACEAVIVLQRSGGEFDLLLLEPTGRVCVVAAPHVWRTRTAVDERTRVCLRKLSRSGGMARTDPFVSRVQLVPRGGVGAASMLAVVDVVLEGIPAPVTFDVMLERGCRYTSGSSAQLPATQGDVWRAQYDTMRLLTARAADDGPWDVWVALQKTRVEQAVAASDVRKLLRLVRENEALQRRASASVAAVLGRLNEFALSEAAFNRTWASE